MTISSLIEPVILSNDLARELGPKGISEINHILWLGYHEFAKELSESDKVSLIEEEEDFISGQWYYYINLIWSKENRAMVIKKREIVPVTQFSDSTKKKSKKSPSIDICFRNWDGALKTSRYIGVECKKIDLNKSRLTKRYCETGVNHFISGYYGSFSSISMMAGFIHNGSIKDVVSKIGDAIELNSDKNAILVRERSLLEPQYYSEHIRDDGVEIQINHLFLDFTPISQTV